MILAYLLTPLVNALERKFFDPGIYKEIENQLKKEERNPFYFYYTDNYYCYFSRLWFLFYYDPQPDQQYPKYFHGSSHLCEQSDEIHGQVF